MLFRIARVLDEPFNTAEYDVKLNKVCAQLSLQLLHESYTSKVEHDDVIDETHSTPYWLEDSSNSFSFKSKPSNPPPLERRQWKMKPNWQLPRTSVIIGVTLYSLWTLGVGLFVRSLQTDSTTTVNAGKAQWWAVYLPLSPIVTRYLSACVFLVMAFWIRDAYAHYWHALSLWRTKLGPIIRHLAFHMSVTPVRGRWHDRDRERILSHFAALSYVLKQHLRDSRDLSELSDILSQKDIEAIRNAPHMPQYVMHVICTYYFSTDRDQYPKESEKYSEGLRLDMFRFGKLEDVIIDCEVIKNFVISPAFSIHLQGIAALWVSILPFTIVLDTAFLSLLYTVPVIYAMFNLISVAKDLTNPFDQQHDYLPLEQCCSEIKASINTLYCELDTSENVKYYIKSSSSYQRESLQIFPPPPEHRRKSTTETGLLTEYVKIFREKYLPSIPKVALTLSVVWNIIAVFASRALSFQWSPERRELCHAWCSPINVPGRVLGNIGLALFVILVFRASDSLDRYAEGAGLFNQLKMNLRTLAVEVVQSMPSGAIHNGSKERIIAHLAQLPLLFRDQLGGRTPVYGSFLNENDREILERSDDPMETLIRTVEMYILNTEPPAVDADGFHLQPHEVTTKVSLIAIWRLDKIRRLVTTALTMKQFPFISGYRRPQQMFVAVWLLLLPLAIVSETGYFTVVWASMIAFTILTLEQIAIHLTDPFGDDLSDLPVTSLCHKMSAAIVDAINSVGWGVEEVTVPSPLDQDNRLGAVCHQDGHIYNQFTVASLDYPTMSIERNYKNTNIEDQQKHLSSDHSIEDKERSVSSQFTSNKSIPGSSFEESYTEFSSPTYEKQKPSLFAHVLLSSPWGRLSLQLIYTIGCVLLSYFTRDRAFDGKVRWWKSSLSISREVADYISIIALTVLGFFARFSYERYNAAGTVWGGKLGGLLHSITSQFILYIPDGTLHEGDQKRIIGHIAALPTVLKQELRELRDLRAIKGLLSAEDVAKIQYSPSMSARVMDVIRSYLYTVLNYGEYQHIADGSAFLGATLWLDLIEIEKTIELLKRIKNFKISPSFVTIINILLGSWLIILPFAIAEISGWFTILWLPLISYGVLGMYSISSEIQNPFGMDVNNLDLDEYCTFITGNVLQRYHLKENTTLPQDETLEEFQTPKIWSLDEDFSDTSPLRKKQKKESKFQTTIERVKLAVQPFSISFSIFIVSWSSMSVLASYLVSRRFPQPLGDAPCFPWFCSAIALDPNVKEYIAFSLFYLLAFRLNNSHNRYVASIDVWQELITSQVRHLAQRIFASHQDKEVWKTNGHARLAGFISAFSLSLMESLRSESYPEKMEQVLCKRDIAALSVQTSKTGYCEDSIRSFLHEADPKRKKSNVRGTSTETMWCSFVLQKLGRTASTCKVIKRIPVPFGFVTHIRTYLLVWILLLPFGIVESAGWLTIIWVILIALGVVGIERWAEYLSDPFGYDVCDLRLEEFCETITNVVRTEYMAFSKGVKSFVKANRITFGTAENA